VVRWGWAARWRRAGQRRLDDRQAAREGVDLGTWERREKRGEPLGDKRVGRSQGAPAGGGENQPLPAAVVAGLASLDQVRVREDVDELGRRRTGDPGTPSEVGDRDRLTGDRAQGEVLGRRERGGGGRRATARSSGLRGARRRRALRRRLRGLVAADLAGGARGLVAPRRLVPLAMVAVTAAWAMLATPL